MLLGFISIGERLSNKMSVQVKETSTSEVADTVKKLDLNGAPAIPGNGDQQDEGQDNEDEDDDDEEDKQEGGNGENGGELPHHKDPS